MQPVYRDADWKRAQSRVTLCSDAAELKGFLRTEASEMAARIAELENSAGRRLPHVSFWRRLNVKLIEQESSHSGGHLETDTLRMVFVRASENKFRKKFTAAHEAAHLLLDHFIAKHPRLLSRNDEESMCDEFASALLIPSSKLDEILKDSTKLTLELVHNASRVLQVNLQPILIAIAQKNRFPDDIAFLAKKVGHPSRPGEIDYRIRRTPHRGIVFLPSNKRLRSLGLGEIGDALCNIPIGAILKGQSKDANVPLWRRGRGSGTASGSIDWEAQLLATGEILAILHTKELTYLWNPSKKPQ